ncbi:group II intron reverse transcriptase/maturase [Salinibius halmophilus]|uniref:group II intron reverse transcriptase/maturase n=1 Tax=Salinibius halmophilus TaxID=1853216 RepID=UPI000E662ADC|nr:group II intron reverse transcriptase/maturase [Salinibius halmophilus]
MQGKAFEIPKSLVWQSYLAVRRNKGAPGCDGQTMKQFDEKRNQNLYKIWNRLCSGSYFPPPVRAKQIPKADGSERTLGIPTISDRIAQGAVKRFLEARLEPIFHDSSFGYRPRRSAHMALAQCERNCRYKSWALEVDIKAFFDHVDHDLIIKALKFHKVPSWVILYCRRWLQAPMVEMSTPSDLKLRTEGTPQGGVISPLLANLFLHYAFDRWMTRHFPHVPFERYADDIVCHCSRMSEATRLKRAIRARMMEVGLKINEAKSHVVYIDTFPRTNVKKVFTFLGYDFKVRTLRNYKGQLFRKCSPGASMKAMKKITQTIKSWRVHRSTRADVRELAQRYNATLRGWITYYGKFWYRHFSYRLWSVFQSRLIKWAANKLRIGTRKAERKLNELRKYMPRLFAHWELLRASNV